MEDADWADEGGWLEPDLSRVVNGSGLPEPMLGAWDSGECAGCMAFLRSQPFLPAACASVGIEHGKSTGQMLRDYLAAYHERGHREKA